MPAETLTVLFLYGTVLLRLVLVGLVLWLLVPRRVRCPACGSGTATLVTPRLVRWLRMERRWCLTCGWDGVGKVTGRRDAAAPTPRFPAAPPAASA